MDGLLADFEDMAKRDGFSAFMGDYGLIGHCSGSLVAYEIAKLLVRSPCRNPQLLVFCSCLPPSLIRDTGTSRLSTEEMFARTAALGGTADALMADGGLLEVLQSPMRADWEIFDGYVHRASARLPVPILAVRGTKDSSVSAADLRLWQEQTSEMLLTAEVESDHWVLTEEGSSTLAREIPAALSITLPTTTPSAPTRRLNEAPTKAGAVHSGGLFAAGSVVDSRRPNESRESHG
jgi:surfactin synthase thioesterase subunit